MPASQAAVRESRSTLSAAAGMLAVVGITSWLMVGPCAVAAQAVAPPAAPLTPVREIGVELGPDETEFSMIVAACFLPGGNIAIADALSKNVRVFTAQGAYLRTLGRQGSGPGEFLLPSALVADSQLRVFDMQQNREVVFDLEGNHVRTRRLPTVPGHSAARAWRLPAGQVVVVTSANFVFGAGVSQPEQFVLHVGHEGRIDTLGRFRAGATTWHDARPPRRWSVLEARFGDGGAVAVTGTVVAFADGYAGRVMFWQGRADGSLASLATVQLPGESREVRASDLREVEADLRAEFRAAGVTLGDLEFRPPPRWSVAQRAFFDAQSTLWVRQEIGSDHAEVWTLLTPGGVVGSWRFPPRVRMLAAGAGVVLGVRTTELGTPVAVLYEFRPDR